MAMEVALGVEQGAEKTHGPGTLSEKFQTEMSFREDGEEYGGELEAS